MIITCPNCSGRFAVKAEAIGPTGRKVRCAKCKHDWFQDPIPEAIEAAVSAQPEPQAAETIMEGSNLPAPVANTNQPPAYMKLAFAASLLLFAFVLSLVNSNKLIRHMHWYYNALGIHDDAGIALYNVSAEKVGGDDKKELLLKGRIVNESKSNKAIPNLRITLLGDNNEKLKIITLDSHDAALTPGEGIDFENKIQKLPENIATVVMDIGNPINLMIR